MGTVRNHYPTIGKRLGKGGGTGGSYTTPQSISPDIRSLRPNPPRTEEEPEAPRGRGLAKVNQQQAQSPG